MSYTLTKRIDSGLFVDQLVAAGVHRFNIDGAKVYLPSDLTAGERVAQLAIIGNVEAAHVPTTFTEVVLAAAPHTQLFTAELEAVGAVGVGLVHPSSYPGTGYVLHTPATDEIRAAIKIAAEAHDPTAFPKLSIDPTSLVVAADGEDTAAVTITDSRGAAAAGNTVKLRVPPNVGVAVDADAFALDGSGQAVATFGPSSVITGQMVMEFLYENKTADPITLIVRFGTP